MLAQTRVRAVHVAHDDRDVLKPAVVAAGIHRCRTATRSHILGQLDVLVTEPQPGNPHPYPEDALQPVDF